MNQTAGKGKIFKENKKIYSTHSNYLKLLMRRKDGQFGFDTVFYPEIFTALSVLKYPAQDVYRGTIRRQHTFYDMLRAYKASEEFRAIEDGSSARIDISEAARDKLIDDFYDAAFDTAFGEPTQKQQALMQKCYGYAEEKFKEGQDLSQKDDLDKDNENVVVLESTKQNRPIYSVYLKGEAGEVGPNPKPSPKPNPNPTPRIQKSLDEDRINKYIQAVENLGIECECEAHISGGTKINNNQEVIMFVFKVGEYKICESIGQAGNRTYILKSDASTDDFMHELGRRDTNLQGLVKSGEAIGVNHKGAKGKDYIFNPNRILILSELIASCAPDTKSLSDFRQNLLKHTDSKEILTIEDVKGMVTAELKQNSIPDIIEYVEQFGLWEEVLAKYEEALKGLFANKVQQDFNKNPGNAGLTASQLERKGQQLVNLSNLRINSENSKKIEDGEKDDDGRA